MTDVELRRLKRTELLEMLLEQSKENESLKQKVEELETKLANREICLNEAGTIANAAFEMNGVLAATQAAADQYLENIKLLNDRQETICAQKEAEAKAKAELLLSETRAKCAVQEKEAEEKCAELIRKAEQDVEARWEELSKKLEDFYRAHSGLKELITATGGVQRD